MCAEWLGLGVKCLVCVQMSSVQAEKYKEQGNAEFKKGNHAKAIEFYTYATEIDPRNHLLFSNRATAYYTMQKYDKSLRDSEKAIALNNSWWKVTSSSSGLASYLLLLNILPCSRVITRRSSV
jgi:tetratricopeptide (TPR) repeat protein